MLAKIPHTCGLQRLVKATHCCTIQRSPAQLRIPQNILLQRGNRRHAPHRTHRPSPTQRRRMQDCHVSSGSEIATAGGGSPQVAMNGDIVHVRYVCKDEQGNVVDDSAHSEEPVCFEVGAGEVTGNPLFQAFDEAIRGCALGETAVLEAKGGDWQRELFFEVPRDHQEVTRLEGRYKSQGGLKDGMLVELANGESAMIVALRDDVVQIDANNMMAGRTRTFEVTLHHIEPANT